MKKRKTIKQKAKEYYGFEVQKEKDISVRISILLQTTIH